MRRNNNTRRKVVLAGFLSLGFVSASASNAHAVYIRADVPVDQYNAIAQLPQYAAAASLRTYTSTVRTENGVNFTSVSTGSCSGTLISPTKVLTAAHCFVDKTGVASKYDTLVVGFDTTIGSSAATPTNVASVAVMPQYAASNGAATNDVAIVTLTAPVTNIKPALLYAGNALNATATMVGYGSQGTGTADGLAGANNRLGAYNIIDSADTSVIRFDFDSPAGNTSSLGSATPIALEGSVAGGDSGSALYAKIGDNYFVVGDLNAGANAINESQPNYYGELNSYAPVANALNAAFIIQNAPDAIFERLNGKTSPAAVTISDTEILNNIQKFGTVLTSDEDYLYDFQDLEVAAVDPTAVPEPATALLLMAGAGATAMLRRRGQASSMFQNTSI